MKTLDCILRFPELNDAKKMYALAKESTMLDELSQYAYLLWTQHFRETTVIAEVNSEVVAFLIGYIVPNQKNTLFLWQMEISDAVRNQGLSVRLAKEMIGRDFCSEIEYVCGTVEEENEASRGFLKALARIFDTKLYEKPFFLKEHFSSDHDEEPLLWLGPIDRSVLKN